MVDPIFRVGSRPCTVQRARVAPWVSPGAGWLVWLWSRSLACSPTLGAAAAGVLIRGCFLLGEREIALPGLGRRLDQAAAATESVTEDQQVSEQVRKEQIETEGDVNARDDNQR